LKVMSKIFISYRFTGENIILLEDVLSNIKASLEDTGNSVFCSYFLENFFQNKHFSTRKIYEYCEDELKKSEFFFAFIKSKEQSKGMFNESNLAHKLGKKYVLAIPPNLDFDDFREKADKIIEYDSYNELYFSLRQDNYFL
jgi:hypothetical protein